MIVLESKRCEVSSILTTITNKLRTLKDNIIMKTNITQVDTNLFKVELKDKYNSYRVVYERNTRDALKYAVEFHKNADERKRKHDLSTNTIEAMIKEDEARGTKLSLD